MKTSMWPKEFCLLVAGTCQVSIVPKDVHCLIAVRHGNLAEWLRRWPAKPMCSARVSSNLTVVGQCFFGKKQKMHLGAPPRMHFDTSIVYFFILDQGQDFFKLQ